MTSSFCQADAFGVTPGAFMFVTAQTQYLSPMKKSIPLLLVFVALASLLRAQPAGATSIPFATSQSQFVSGDNITITEVLSTSPVLGVGATFVVRGTYTLQSQPSARMSISLTTTVPVGVPNQDTAVKQLTNGTGSFEMQYTVQFAGSVYIAFTPAAGGASFGRIYFSGTDNAGNGPSTPTTPTTPITPSVPATPAPPISTTGLASIPFTTSKAQFAAGDAITITEVLASSAHLVPGDAIVVRGTYTLQSQPGATLMISLAANAPGAAEPTIASSRKTIIAGPGTFELAYEIKQPGSLHVTFYPQSGGSSFGGIYFASSSANAANPSTGATLVSPATNTGLLGNLSIRSLVSPGAGTLIAGLSVTDRERYVLIRAVGPSLGQFGVSGVLAKPTLAVYNAAGELVASAASWRTNFSSAQRAGIELLSASVGAFALAAGSDDAVLHLRLVPGSYTVQVASSDAGSGVALMEVYASSTFMLPP